MNTAVVVKPHGTAVMQANIVVTMDDVVSAFVSKYEAQLFARKKVLSTEIANVTTALKELDEVVRNKVDPTAYNTKTFSKFDLVAKAKDEVHIDWNSGRTSFEVVIQHVNDANAPTTSRVYYGSSSINVTMYQDITVEDIEAREQNAKLLQATEREMAEILDKIKSVARKEREVRGRIAMRKIEESGYANLLDDEQLAQLVQL